MRLDHVSQSTLVVGRGSWKPGSKAVDVTQARSTLTLPQSLVRVAWNPSFIEESLIEVT